MKKFLTLILSGFLFVLLASATVRAEGSQHHDFQVDTVVSGLEFPWGMDFLPGGDMLITEKEGALLLVRMPSGERQSVRGLPDNIAAVGQGGLLDVLVHPDFAQNQMIFLSYAGRGDGGYGTEVVRARLNGPRLQDVQKIFVAVPKVRGGHHFGSRLVIGSDDKLYITLGERGQKEQAQDLKTHLGSTIRINQDGSVPEDNPFYDHESYRPEIFTYGNRNVQGAALHPETGEVWVHEHGPKGGDEINILKSGANYGWPAITYGVDYTGFPISDKTSAEGMEQPILYWDPSIAPCGMIFYTGDKFPQWQGDIFAGALVQTHLRRVKLDGTKVVEQEELLGDLGERIRDVAQGPDGYIYLLTDNVDGRLLRLRPAD